MSSLRYVVALRYYRLTFQCRPIYSLPHMVTSSRFCRFPISVLCACNLLFGCSSNTGNASSSEATTCTSLVNDAPLITEIVKPESGPVPTGGSIANARYALSSLVLYTGPGGVRGSLNPAVASAVIEIDGDVMQQVGLVSGVEKRFTSTLKVSGTKLTTVDTCPDTDTEEFQFSASDTQLTISQVITEGTFAQTYSRR